MNGASLPVGGSSWAAVAPDGALTARATVARIGHYCWLESQIFGLLGGWVTQIPEVDAKALVAEQAEHSGWRAQRWFEMLPTMTPGSETGVVPPEGGVAILELAASLGDGVDRTLEKFAVTHRVLVPRLVAACVAHLDWAPAVAEASTRRLLTIVLTDLVGDLVHGERLLQAVTTGQVERRRVAAAADALDEVLTTMGGLLGPGSVGERPR